MDTKTPGGLTAMDRQTYQTVARRLRDLSVRVPHPPRSSAKRRKSGTSSGTAEHWSCTFPQAPTQTAPDMVSCNPGKSAGVLSHRSGEATVPGCGQACAFHLFS